MEAKRIFSYVPEVPAMFDALTVREHLEFIRKAYQSQISDEGINVLLLASIRFDPVRSDGTDCLNIEKRNRKRELVAKLSFMILWIRKRVLFYIIIQKSDRDLRKSCGISGSSFVMHQIGGICLLIV